MTVSKIKEISIYPIEQVENIANFVINLVKSEKGFEHFSISDNGLIQLKDFISQQLSAKLLLGDNIEQISTSEFSKQAIITFIYLTRMLEYREYKKKIDDEKISEFLLKNHMPRENVLPFDRLGKLEPSDCAALQDWPDKRLPSNGVSGKLENAGEFIRRIYASGLYNEEKYGRLQLANLRKINPKLYQAIIQWLKRNPNENLEMLGSKAEEVESRLESYDQGEPLGFVALSRIHSIKARRKRSNKLLAHLVIE